MKNNFDFTGKRILVAGASSGIGKKIAEDLAGNGAQVILLARREALLKEVQAGLTGTGHSYYVADMAELDKIETLVKTIVSEQGSLDGLVYCCGMGSIRPVKLFKPVLVQQIMAINFMGFFELARCITKRNRFNQGLSIVGISSSAATDPDKGQSIYSASKAAMDATVQVMAQEYADKGIRVNTVRPGMIRTEMYQMTLDDVGDEFQKEFVKKQFLGVGETEDVSNAVAYLLSSLSKFVTGAHLAVDGGNTCH